VEGGHVGTGNLDLNPLFADIDNFYLTSPSPCIDAGQPDDIFNDVEDPANPGSPLFPALGGLRNDMGAYGGKSYLTYTYRQELLIQSLTLKIEYLQLPKGIENSLNKKLDDVKKSLSMNKIKTTINKLQEFISKVEAQEGKKITEEISDGLIELAQIIINSIQFNLMKAVKDINLSESDIVPTQYSLEQNYPNPFNPSTTLKYEIPKESYITLKVYDILGREVATLVNKQQKAGYYEIDWNAVNNSSGIYFYKIQAGDFLETKKMILMK